MKYCVFTLLFLALACTQQHRQPTAYEQKLNETKKHYPFDNWRQHYKDGLTQYTSNNCQKAEDIFDELIADLGALGEKADEKSKVALFKKAIEKTNALNRECQPELIETGEREELCDLTNHISIAAGLDPKKYGGGEGLASEWREW